MDLVGRLLAGAGAPDGARSPLAGGDVGEVVRVGEVVVKVGALGREAVDSEVRGLRALGEVVRTPEVLYADASGIVLTYLPPTPLNAEELGRAIATLHMTHEASCGADHRVYLGRWCMPAGRGEEDWVERRVSPLLRVTAPRLGASLVSRVERLLRECRPPREGPTRLHGDLWAGNVLGSPAGPAFIDPAQFAGERAADLAMMDLFGGFGATCMGAYEEVFPIPAEVREHLDYYALLYLLVHVWMFGATYVRATEERVRRMGF